MSDDEQAMVVGAAGNGVVVVDEMAEHQVATGAWKVALEHVVPCVVVLK